MRLQSNLSTARMPALSASSSLIYYQGLAFNNSAYSKTEAVALAELHRQQDHYLKGTYGANTPQGWKGCSVGCMAKGQHGDYPVLFGIDAKIAYLSDAIFEGLPSPDYKDWTVKLFKSVKEGTDTKLAWYRFTYWMLADAEYGVVRLDKDPTILAVVELFRKASEGTEVSQQEWKAAAADAARSGAAYAAAYAVYDVFDAVYAAYDAARACAYAARAADAARAAARAAANDSARAKHYQIMADKLCYFLAGN